MHRPVQMVVGVAAGRGGVEGRGGAAGGGRGGVDVVVVVEGGVSTLFVIILILNRPTYHDGAKVIKETLSFHSKSSVENYGRKERVGEQ